MSDLTIKIKNSINPMPHEIYGVQPTQYWYNGIFSVSNDFSRAFGEMMFMEQTSATLDMVQQVSDEYHGIDNSLYGTIRVGQILF